MQLFSADQKFAADATMFLKKFYNFFAPGNMKKHPQKLLIIGPDPFFQCWPGCPNGTKTEIPYNQKPLNAGLGI